MLGLEAIFMDSIQWDLPGNGFSIQNFRIVWGKF